MIILNVPTEIEISPFSSKLAFHISLFHRAFFNSIFDKHQHMHLTFNSILV